MKKLLFTLIISIPFLACAQDAPKETDKKDGSATITMEGEEQPVEAVEVVEVVEINWMSFEEAFEAQKTAPKKIFADVYTVWCGPCKNLDKYTFHNPDVVAFVNENYYAVKFDAESPDPITYKGQEFTNADFDPTVTRGRNGVHSLSRAFKVGAYPTMLFLDETGNVITSVKGYQRPTQLEIYLKLFASNDYIEINTNDKWAEYQAEFVGEFID